MANHSSDYGYTPSCERRASNTITVTMSNGGGVLDSETFSYNPGDDMQDAGAAAREIAERMIREAGHLMPGDCIRVTEG